MDSEWPSKDKQRLMAVLHHIGFAMPTQSQRDAEAIARYARSVLLDDPSVAAMEEDYVPGESDHARARRLRA